MISLIHNNCESQKKMCASRKTRNGIIYTDTEKRPKEVETSEEDIPQSDTPVLISCSINSDGILTENSKIATCSECGFTYLSGVAEDEKKHTQLHPIRIANQKAQRDEDP